MELDEPMGKLTDRMQIKREHGVTLLQSVLSNADPLRRQELWAIATQRVKLLMSAQQWESRHGGFCAAKILVLGGQQMAFDDELLPLATLHLEDTEPGVRLAVGECLYALGKVQGISVYDSIKDRLLLSIQNGFDGDLISGDESDQDAFEESPVKKMPSVKQVHSGQNGAMGSRCLETSVKALQRLMEGCGESFQDHVTSQLWQLLLKALSHHNRFVRETGFLCVSTLCQFSPMDVLKDNGGLIASYLALGLSDNWSQVRYAASIATRTFMRRTSEFKSDFFSKLLPAMCLNRYHGAEGLRLYSQETWQLVMGSTGREEVAKYVDVVLDYYIVQSTAQNHLVKEAACHCMAELLWKIDPERIGSLVPRVLTTLMSCFKDPSWAVRDAACSAMRKAIEGYPEEMKKLMPQLFDMWFAHLADNVRSVRENSAFTLGSAMRCFQGEAIEMAVAVLQEVLPQAKNQVDKPCCCHGSLHATQCASPGAGPHHGRPPSAEENMDGALSSNLLPKLAERCDDYGFSRKSEPWEKSEGGIYLLRELSVVAPDRAAKFLPALVQLAQSSGYVEYHSLMETLYRLLPFIAEKLGKKTFKPYLELFIDPLFSALTCGQRLSENASGYCVSKLISFIGPNIFKARLDSNQLAILQSSPLINAHSMTGDIGTLLTSCIITSSMFNATLLHMIVLQ
uniref:TOG domain-containing protein n=1 Tax=Physcomitrium patens TaxID=3218 RepID=A0A7I4BI56_PHYPA